MGKLANRARMSCTSSGLDDFQTDTAAIGHQDFTDAGIVDGDEISYMAETASRTEWETGRGIWDAMYGIVERVEVLDSSAGFGVKVTFSSPPDVAIDALADDIQNSTDDYGSITSSADANYDYGGLT